MQMMRLSSSALALSGRHARWRGLALSPRAQLGAVNSLSGSRAHPLFRGAISSLDGRRYLSTGGDDKQPQPQKDTGETIEPSLMDQLMETQYVWGFFSNGVASIAASLFELYFSFKRGSFTSKEIAAKYGFDEAEFLEGCKVAYMRISNVFARGEPVFQTQYLDMVDKSMADMLDTQLGWYRKTKRMPRLVVGEVSAKLLYMDRVVPMRKVNLEEVAKTATETRKSGKEFVFEDVVPTDLYAFVLFESNEGFEIAPIVGADKRPDPPLSKRKHIVMFTSTVPMGVLPGKEADNVEFRFQWFI